MRLEKLLNRRYYVIYLLVIGAIITCVIYVWLRANIKIAKIADLAIIQLPGALKERLLTDSDSELFYIDYHAQTLQYYFISHNEVRTKIILNSLKKIIISKRYNIPEGHYLLSLHDAAPHKYSVPVLAFASDKDLLVNNDVILIPDPFALKGYKELFNVMNTGALKYTWDAKIPKIFFRGSAYGAGPENNDINGFARLRFMNMAANLEFADVGFTSYTAQLNTQFKARVAKLHPLKPAVSETDSQAYKYLIDVDGNTCSFSRMAWILYSNSVLLKPESTQVQWYYARLKPYIHYLPINADFSNLRAQFNWAQAHQQMAEEIANNGHNLARDIFTQDNIFESLATGFTQYHALTQ